MVKHFLTELLSSVILKKESYLFCKTILSDPPLTETLTPENFLHLLF